jgi:mono/diheme cytochrome c family protein
MTAKVNWALLIALAVSLLANVILRRDVAQPNIDILPDMAHAVAYTSFSVNPVLPGGKTLQPPVPGTLARGMERLHYTATAEDAVRAGRELHNPLEPAAARTRGEAVYLNFCTPCHGPAMRGDGPVSLRGYPAPANLTSGKSLDVPEGQMFHILTFGQKNMPSHASQLTAKDRWSVIAYVRAAQQAAQAASAAAVPPGGAQK